MNERLGNRFDQASNHFAKYRCFILRNSNIYRNLIIASLINGNYFELDSAGLRDWHLADIDVWYNTSDGSIYSWNTHFSNQSNAFDSILNQSEKFGVQCQSLFNTEEDSTKRLIQLHEITDRVFTNKKFKNYLDKFILIKLNKIYDEKNWHQIIQWIVFDEWPPSGGMSGSTGPGISYTNRFASYDDYDNRKYHLYQTLLITDKNIVDTLLMNEWQSAFLDKEKYYLEPPKFSIASLGFNIGIDNILLIVAPILFFFQALFFLYWLKERQLLSNNDIQQPFLFPDFNIAGSPFSIKDFNRSLTYFLTNLFWTIFLLLPIIILFFGFLTRYDIVSVKSYPNDTDSFLKNMLWYRTTDLASISIDIITLLSLAFSFIIILFITKKSDSETEIKFPSQKFNKWLISFLFVFSVLLSLLLKIKFDYSETIFFIIIQWCIWIYFAIVSVLNKAAFAFIICFSALAVNLLLLFN